MIDMQHKEYFSQCYKYIKQKLNNLNINNVIFIDESDAFKSLSSNDFIFIDSYHYGDRGTEFIAKKLFKDMRNIILQEQ
jgi:beta-galactosidase GanA